MLQKVTIENPEIFKAVESYLPAAYLAMNNMCKSFLSAERRVIYNPPKSYLEMLNQFQVMLQKKRGDNEETVSRLEKGVEKLKKAAADVVHLEGKYNIKYRIYMIELTDISSS